MGVSSIDKRISYGHDIIETTAIPIIIADFTLNDIKYAVSTPPHMIPIHIYSLVRKLRS